MPDRLPRRRQAIGGDPMNPMATPVASAGKERSAMTGTGGRVGAAGPIGIAIPAMAASGSPVGRTDPAGHTPWQSGRKRRIARNFGALARTGGARSSGRAGGQSRSQRKAHRLG